jgi:hypothetical protein
MWRMADPAPKLQPGFVNTCPDHSAVLFNDNIAMCRCGWWELTEGGWSRIQNPRFVWVLEELSDEWDRLERDDATGVMTYQLAKDGPPHRLVID